MSSFLFQFVGVPQFFLRMRYPHLWKGMVARICTGSSYRDFCGSGPVRYVKTVQRFSGGSKQIVVHLNLRFTPHHITPQHGDG